MKNIEPLVTSSEEESQKVITDTEESESRASTEEMLPNSFDANIPKRQQVQSDNQAYVNSSPIITKSSNGANIALTTIAILFIVFGIINLIYSLTIKTTDLTGAQDSAAQLAKYFGIIVSATYLISGAGLYFKNDTVRAITVILIGINLFVSIGLLIFSGFEPVRLTQFVVLLFLMVFLSSQKVKNLF